MEAGTWQSRRGCTPVRLASQSAGGAAGGSDQVTLAPESKEAYLKVALDSGIGYIVFVEGEYMAGRGDFLDRLGDLADVAAGGLLGRGEIKMPITFNIRSQFENDGGTIPVEMTLAPNETHRVGISRPGKLLYGPGWVSVFATNESAAAHVRVTLSAQPRAGQR
jgi:hypothetical protein